jgi:hypothetical protein
MIRVWLVGLISVLPGWAMAVGIIFSPKIFNNFDWFVAVFCAVEMNYAGSHPNQKAEKLPAYIRNIR